MNFDLRRMLLLCLVLLVNVWSFTDAQGAVSTQHRLNSEITNEAWHHTNYPNPRTEPEQCGRSRASWVCDPDHILKKDHADELDLLINSIRSSTACPCPASMCTSDRGGYAISIAMMNKMYRQTSDLTTLLNDARNFAFALEREKWRFDRCDEDILIVFSLRDNIVFAVTGMKAREKITDDILHEVVMDSTQFFQHNPYMGLKHMIYAIRHALTDRIHVFRGERHHLSDVYSYRRASRPRLASNSDLGSDGYVIGSYRSSANHIQYHGLTYLVLLCSLIPFFNLF